MKVVRKSEGTVYEAPFHFNVWSTRKLAAGEGKDSARVSVSLSHFLPNGRVDMSGTPAPMEKVYLVLSGQLYVKSENGSEATLQPGDIVYFTGTEKREAKVVGTDPLTIFVCIINV